MAFALASNASPRHTKRPLAPNERAIDGQANDSSTLESSSAIPREGSVIEMVPSLTRISENVSPRPGLAALGFSVRARVAIRSDQLERPSGCTFTTMCGRVSDTSAGSILPISSGQQLQLGGELVGDQRRLGRGVAERDVGETHHRGRKQRDLYLAADGRLEPGDGADVRDHRIAHRSGRNQRRNGDKRGDPGRKDGRDDKA